MNSCWQYEAIYFQISKTEKERKEPWFIAERRIQANALTVAEREAYSMNPSSRLPALIDHHQNNHTVWESHAIIQYVIAIYDKGHKLYPEDVFAQS
jgi:glutathione S-transferase